MDDSEGFQGNVVSDWQFSLVSVPAHASHVVQRFLVKHQITQVAQPPFSPALAPCDFSKIAFEREEISVHQLGSEKYNRAADGNWENCVRSQGAYFEGD